MPFRYFVTLYKLVESLHRILSHNAIKLIPDHGEFYFLIQRDRPGRQGNPKQLLVSQAVATLAEVIFKVKKCLLVADNKSAALELFD